MSGDRILRIKAALVAGSILLPFAAFGQESVLKRMREAIEKAQQTAPRAQTQAGRSTQARPPRQAPAAAGNRTAGQPTRPGATPKIAGYMIGPGFPLSIQFAEAIDSAGLHQGDTVTALLTDGHHPNLPMPKVTFTVTKLAGPAGGGYADVFLALTSIDNNGSPFSIVNTTLRLMSDQADMEKAQAEAAKEQQQRLAADSGGEVAASPNPEIAAASHEAETTSQVEEIFGIGKKLVRVPAQTVFPVTLGTTLIALAPGTAAAEAAAAQRGTGRRARKK